ncbi:hypothetical protein LMG6871_02874 [Ralstonia edaphis]|uniref:winged helix-turn-helix domain-containing protein n=1 Tax=Ralstonia edaphi TaxID=3058599 RepID=UPI0028F5E81D|nr:winged helix-turn-helix domain-containing protein [Ralstonia sp. LMG 6871]CAJ0719452.1 hypothetical protein LMG6871_02874 [Ralstonia sp. LMG 6871]
MKTYNADGLRAYHKARREAAVKAMLDLLEASGEAGVTQAEISSITGASKRTVHRRLDELRDLGKVHIWTWRRVFKALVPVYRVGDGPDADRSVRKVADAEKEDAEAAARAEMRRRHEAWESKWRPHRDAAAAWITV